jgi:hypothetical protein
MSYYGMKSWPPVWVNTQTVPIKKITGEIGTLVRTAFFPETPKRLFLIMEFENERYMGCLVFSKPGFWQQLSQILHTNAGRSIEDIENLDLSHTL